MSETAAVETKTEAPKAFFRREYTFGARKVQFHLRKMRVSELREATQKFSDIDDRLSPLEKEEAENDVYVEVLSGFAERREAANVIKEAFKTITEDDGWILRDVWNDYQISHRPKVSFL